MTDKIKELSIAIIASLKVGGKFDPAKVKAKTSGLAKSAANVVAGIHAVGVACLQFAAPVSHGGNTNGEPARQLVNALPKGVRQKALVAWLEAHSNIRLRYDKKAGEYTVKLIGPDLPKMFKDGDTLAALAIAGEAQPFWSVAEKDHAPSEFDAVARLERMLAAADKFDSGVAQIIRDAQEAVRVRLAAIDAAKAFKADAE
jgi:hypothetical protein